MSIEQEEDPTNEYLDLPLDDSELEDYSDEEIDAQIKEANRILDKYKEIEFDVDEFEE
jgi:hypothetical protein